MTTQVVILAAGKGTRMGESELPKVTIELNGKPLISYILEEVQKIPELGIPIIVKGFKFELLDQKLGSWVHHSSIQGIQQGTAHAVMMAQPKITAENTLILYGDMPFIKAESIKKLMNLHYERKSKVSMFTTEVPNFESPFESLHHFGRVIRNDLGDIEKVTEFKDATEEEKQIKEVNPGIYIFNTQWLKNNIDEISNQNAQGEYYLTDIIEIAINQGISIESLKIESKQALGINSKEDLEVAEKMF